MRSTTTFSASFTRTIFLLLLSTAAMLGCGSSGDGDDSVDVVQDDPSEPSEPSIPDPMSESVTSVTFEITVPTYVSDELQVRIAWGATVRAADWNGDQSWSATVELPSDEERLLRVDFLDRNGDLPLGTFERDFRTGTNAAETYTIGPGNFDTARWDADRDGAANLVELLAGTDPLSADVAPSPIGGPPPAEELTPLGAIERVSGFYERSLPKTRPYTRSIEIRPPNPDDFSVPRLTERTEIDIDASGTGSFSRFVESRNEGDEDIRRATLDATRTVGDGIEWSGTYAWSVSSAGLSETFAFTTRTAAAGERISQRGTIEWQPLFWERQGTTNVEYALLGERIDGTPRCAPVSGRVAFVETDVYVGADPAETPLSTTISREPGEEYWSVDARYADGSRQGSLRASLDLEFHCDFGEL